LIEVKQAQESEDLIKVDRDVLNSWPACPKLARVRGEKKQERPNAEGG